MAVCQYCDREMTETGGCSAKYVKINGKIYPRIPANRKDCFSFDKCPDCDALLGRYHHPGCDCEQCPESGKQLLGRFVLDKVNVEFLKGE